MQPEKPALDDDLLLHYGVVGMKWGHRKARATSSDIKRARRGLRAQNDKYGQLEDRMTYGKNENKALNDKLTAQMKKMDEDFKKDPRRVIATRLTRGEKVAAVILGGPIGVAVIAGTSARSRRIEYKQDRQAGIKP